MKVQRENAENAKGAENAKELMMERKSDFTFLLTACSAYSGFSMFSLES